MQSNMTMIRKGQKITICEKLFTITNIEKAGVFDLVNVTMQNENEVIQVMTTPYGIRTF